MHDVIDYLMGDPGIAMKDFIIPVVASLLIGLLLAGVHMYRNRSTGSLTMTLIILPAVVCAVIMAVNGNIGAGVAVAGTFSLVRFRSAQGNAREICTLFTAMAAGLLTGMGFIVYALVFTMIIGAAIVISGTAGIGAERDGMLHKNLRITIPEDLDYSGVFDDVLERYTSRHQLISSKTTNMGSLFRLSYDITLLESVSEKELIDELRCLNGNLEISMSVVTGKETIEL